MRIVLDTNVFVSAIFWRGAPHQILKLAERRVVTIVSSPEVFEELIGVLWRDKFTPFFIEANVGRSEVLKHVSGLVETYSVVEAISVIKSDPSDNKFLACALAGGASYIVSGDWHLLNLEQYRGIEIVTPQQFLKYF